MTTFLAIVAAGLAIWLVIALFKVDVQKRELLAAELQRTIGRNREDDLAKDNAWLDTLLVKYAAAIEEWRVDGDEREAYVRELERDLKGAMAAYNAAYDQLCNESHAPEIEPRVIYAEVITGENLLVDRPNSLDEVLAGLSEPPPLDIDLSLTGSFNATDALSPKKRHQLAQKHREQEVAAR